MELALQGRSKSFHYISTVGVTLNIDESQNEWPTDLARYAYGYSLSKWQGELLCHELRSKGVPVDIYRCDTLLGHRTTPGLINTDDFLSRLVIGLAKTGIAPQSFGLKGKTEFGGLPVDIAVEAIVRGIQSCSSGLHHLNKPELVRNFALEDVVEEMNRLGYAVETCASYEDWFLAFEARLHALTPAEQKHTCLAILEKWKKPQSDARLQLPSSVLAFRYPKRYIEKLLSDLTDLGMISKPSHKLAVSI
jgi:fatty acid CoA ligase FadD9